MGEIVLLAAAATSVVSGAATIAGGVMQRNSQVSAARKSAQLAREQTDAENAAARADAASEEHAIRQDLNAVLSSQRAIMGASGAEFDSVTNDAIQGASREEAEGDRMQARANLDRTLAANERRMQGADLQARSAISSANAGMLAAIGKGTSSIVSGAGKFVEYQRT